MQNDLAYAHGLDWEDNKQSCLLNWDKPDNYEDDGLDEYGNEVEPEDPDYDDKEVEWEY